MSHLARFRFAVALATAPLLTAGLAVAAQPASALPADGPTGQASERLATAKPKIGTYEGTFGPKDARTYFSLDVDKRKGRLRIKEAVILYYCAGEPATGDPGFSTYGKVAVRNGRFSKQGIVSINGSFRSRTKVVGKANPAPGLLDCTGKPLPFTATWVGKPVDRSGDYQGVDATGAPVSFMVDGAGRVISDIEVTRKVQCGSHSYNSLFAFGRAGLSHTGAAANTLVTPDPNSTFTYRALFDSSRNVTGTYQVTGEGCDTGPVAFTAAPTS